MRGALNSENLLLKRMNYEQLFGINCQVWQNDLRHPISVCQLLTSEISQVRSILSPYLQRVLHIFVNN